MDRPGDSSKRTAPDWRASFREAGPYLGLGMQLAMAMAFFTVGGYLLDRWLSTEPWLTIAGAVVGIVAVFAQLIRVTNELSRKGRAERSRQGPEDGPREDRPS